MLIIFYLAIGECNSGSQSCSTNASCINAPEKDICVCPLGYTGDGKSCTGFNLLN